MGQGSHTREGLLLWSSVAATSCHGRGLELWRGAVGVISAEHGDRAAVCDSTGKVIFAMGYLPGTRRGGTRRAPPRLQLTRVRSRHLSRAAPRSARRPARRIARARRRRPRRRSLIISVLPRRVELMAGGSCGRAAASVDRRGGMRRRRRTTTTPTTTTATPTADDDEPHYYYSVASSQLKPELGSSHISSCGRGATDPRPCIRWPPPTARCMVRLIDASMAPANRDASN